MEQHRVCMVLEINGTYPLTMSHLANVSHPPNARRRRRHVEEPKGKMVMAPNYLALGAWYWNIEGTSGKWFSAIGGVISKLRFFSNCSIVLCSIHYIAWVLISILPTCWSMRKRILQSHLIQSISSYLFCGPPLHVAYTSLNPFFHKFGRHR
jgi:hypothetical protein